MRACLGKNGLLIGAVILLAALSALRTPAPKETEPAYRYLHTIARNDAETAAQVYSEWIPRSEQIDVSVHAPRK